jgi:probable O-glycosylation ligase (exosortase A-associated)
MNPHRLTFGFAFSMPFAQIVALVLFAAMLFSKEKKSLPWQPVLGIWLLYLGWMLVSSVFAIYTESALTQLIKIYKIQIVTLLTLVLINNPQRLHQLIWVIVASIGFFSTKGGLFTITSGGGARVWGPPGSFIQENNSLALATLMIIPLMIYLFQFHRQNKWLRYAIGASILLSIVSAIGSQSRGALVAIIAVSGFFWWRSKLKIVTGLGILILAAVIFAFMPSSWHDRMSTIQNYEEDASAMGRINAWQYSINAANSRLTGAGLESWHYETFSMWAPNPNDVHAAHSIYFGPLADHGWPGLILFISILFISWRSLSRISRQWRGSEEYGHLAFLAQMIQVSFVAYLSGGAFLSLAYFDLPWHLIAITYIMQSWLPKQSGLNARKPVTLVER